MVLDRKLYADCKTHKQRIIIVTVSISILLLGFQRLSSPRLLLHVQQGPRSRLSARVPHC